MRKRASKVRAVNRSVSRRFGRVEIFAAGAVEFDGFVVRYVRETEGKEGLAVTEYAWATTKVSFLVLFDLGERRE